MCEIELSHMGLNKKNPNLVCEKLVIQTENISIIPYVKPFVSTHARSPMFFNSNAKLYFRLCNRLLNYTYNICKHKSQTGSSITE